MSEAAKRNVQCYGRWNGSDYHFVAIKCEIEHGGIADGYSSCHSHDSNAVGGKGGPHRERLNKLVLVARNGVIEKIPVKKGSYLTTDKTTVDVKYAR